MCDEGCIYNSIDLEKKIISCDCKVKTNLNINETSLNIYKFDNIEIDSNFGLIKCYKLVFSIKGKSDNIGFWIFLILISAHILLLFLYCYKGITPIKQYLINKMEKFGYIQGYENINKKSSENINVPPKNKQKNNLNLKINESTSINKLKLSERDLNNKINCLNIKNENKNKNNDTNIKSFSTNNINTIINNNNKRRQKNKRKKKLKIKKVITNSLILENSKKEISSLTTDFDKKIINKINKEEKKENKEKKENIANFNFINIDLNKKEKEQYIPKSSNIILNNYTFEEAIKYDLRSICAILYIYL